MVSWPGRYLMHAGRQGTDRAGEVRARPLHPAEVQPNLRRRTGVDGMIALGGSNAPLHAPINYVRILNPGSSTSVFVLHEGPLLDSHTLAGLW